MQKLAAVIFDMDGVLVDSEALHMESELLTCKHFGINAPVDEWENFKGRTGKETFSYLINNFSAVGLDLQTVLDFNSRAYLSLAGKKLKAIDGAMDFLKRCKKGFEKLALATSGGPKSQKMVFDKFRLHGLFDVIITGKDVENSKPHPEPYLKASEKLGRQPEKCAVVEDSVNGIMSAKSAGCHAIGITTSFSNERLQQAGADLVISSFSELSDLNMIHNKTIYGNK